MHSEKEKERGKDRERERKKKKGGEIIGRFEGVIYYKIFV